MLRDVIFGLIGGLFIFMFGMHLMSDGMQKVAGQRMKNILAFLTKNRFMGVGVGATVTAVIQSSSATTVMIVGFVNAGIMTLSQAIGVVMGANIGTTITAQIIAFRIQKVAPLFIAIGCILMLFSKSKRWRLYGQVTLGFGFLFFGLSEMGRGVAPLKQHEVIRTFLQRFSTAPLLAILAGTLSTCLLQSSSATIGLAIVLAQQGLIDLSGAIPLIIGDNIGTTITAQIAAIGTNVSARRTAMSHTMFNMLGALIFFPFVASGAYENLIVHLTPGRLSQNTIGHFIANSHTLFNVLNTCIFLGLIKVLEQVSIRLVPGEILVQPGQPQYLEQHLLENPPIALEMAKRETRRMLGVAEEAVKESVEALMQKNPQLIDSVAKNETAVDHLQSEITRYLIDLSQRSLSKEESEQLPTLIHTVNDIERVGDHAVNITELAEVSIADKLSFSDVAQEELTLMYGAIRRMFHAVGESIEESSKVAARQALQLESAVNEYQVSLSHSHIQRLQNGVCDFRAGIIFIDTVNNLEKIGDHLANVAQAAYNGFRWSGGKLRPPVEALDDSKRNLVPSEEL
jgi:phosphate:Na+ symporter